MKSTRTARAARPGSRGRARPRARRGASVPRRRGSGAPSRTEICSPELRPWLSRPGSRWSARAETLPSPGRQPAEARLEPPAQLGALEAEREERALRRDERPELAGVRAGGRERLLPPVRRRRMLDPGRSRRRGPTRGARRVAGSARRPCRRRGGGALPPPAPGRRPRRRAASARRRGSRGPGSRRRTRRRPPLTGCVEGLRLTAPVDGRAADRRERSLRQLRDLRVERGLLPPWDRRGRLEVRLRYGRPLEPLAQAALADRVDVDRDRSDERRTEEDDEERRREDDAVGESALQDHAHDKRYDEIAVVWFGLFVAIIHGSCGFGVEEQPRGSVAAQSSVFVSRRRSPSSE